MTLSPEFAQKLLEAGNDRKALEALMRTIVDEVDCNSGRHRRVFHSGHIQYLD